MSEPTLATIVTGIAAGLDTSVVISGGEMTWRRGETAFAVLRGGTIELRLDPAIGAAARKTPDTDESARGPAWVRFTPATLAGHDLDRLEAWFGLAYRRTETPPRRT